MYGNPNSAKNRRPPGCLGGVNLAVTVQRVPKCFPPVANTRWTTPNVDLIESLDTFAWSVKPLEHRDSSFSRLTRLFSNATCFLPVAGDPVSDAIRVLMNAPTNSITRVCGGIDHAP